MYLQAVSSKKQAIKARYPLLHACRQLLVVSVLFKKLNILTITVINQLIPSQICIASCTKYSSPKNTLVYGNFSVLLRLKNIICHLKL
jgi:hypothetical protein